MMASPSFGQSVPPEPPVYLIGQAMALSDDLAVVVDLEGRVTYVNPAVSRILGFRPEEVVGRFLWSFVPDPDIVGSLMMGTVDYGQWHGDLPVRAKSGGDVTLQARTVMVQSKEGRILGIVCVGRDEDERRRVEDHLVHIEQQLQVGQLASGVAHDFNNALTLIIGHAQQIVAEGGLDERTQQGLASILQAARGASDLSQRLQARPGASPELLDLNAHVLSTIDATRPRWERQTTVENRSVKLVTDLKAIGLVNGLASEVDEVLTNLIFNAVDAMPEGGTILARSWDEGDEVRLALTDSGTGMAAETKRRLGEMFFTTKEGGHGIGLAASYRIIQGMGGRIDVESTLGEGTTFCICLPQSPSLVEILDDETPLGAPKEQPLRILVVEDDEQVGDLVTAALTDYRVLRALGYVVHSSDHYWLWRLLLGPRMPLMRSR